MLSGARNLKHPSCVFEQNFEAAPEQPSQQQPLHPVQQVLGFFEVR